MFRLIAALLLSVAGLRSAEANTEKTFTLPGGAEIEMVWIEPGTFVMGTDSLRTLWGGPDPRPPHQVTLTRGFWMAKYELTMRQWDSLANTLGGLPTLEDQKTAWGDHFTVSDIPIWGLAWWDVAPFIEKLNAAEGHILWRLPTEAEWEYACRAGTTTDWFWGDDPGQYENYGWQFTWDGGPRDMHPIGQKLPNPWGLYDIYGNAGEWCQDRYARYSPESQTDPLQTVAELIKWNTLCSGYGTHGFEGCELWVVRSMPVLLSLHFVAGRSADRWASDCGEYTGLRLVRDDPVRSAAVTSDTWGRIKKAHSEK